MPDSTSELPEAASESVVDAVAPVGEPFVATNADFLFALAALREMTSNDSIGPPLGSISEDDGSVTVYFDNNLSGYPGWRWTVSIAHVDSETSTILETELTPGDDALLSPAWVPWVDRLADYRTSQDALGEGDDSDDESDDSDDESDDDLDDDDLGDDDDSDDDEDDSDDDDDDDDDDDESDDDLDDDLGGDNLHSGDVDGVDIDEDDLDESDDDESGDDESGDDESGDGADDDDADGDDADGELTVSAAGVNEADKAEGDADDAGPDEPGFGAGDSGSDNEEEHDKSY